MPKEMTVVHINTYDTRGGAAIACTRLNKSLGESDVDSKLIVLIKYSQNIATVPIAKNFIQRKIALLRLVIEKMKFFPFEKDSLSRFAFSTGKTGIDISVHPLIQEADIINIHWINFGYLSLQTLKKIFDLGKPIVWTLHDMWPFTGGCHHSYECYNFKENCGNCMYLKNPNDKDLSNKLHKIKANIFSEKNIHVVSVSSWLKERAESSSLFIDKIHSVIPNAIDTNQFKIINENLAKEKLNLDKNKEYILFGAPKLDDNIKGIEYFINALTLLKTKNWNIENHYEILLFGKIKDNKTLFLDSFPFKVNYLGYVKSELLPDIYSASAITVVTSLYETFGQVISESMSCSTPVIAFNNSGQKDIIDHKINGYLASYKSTEDVATGIEWILNNSDIKGLKKKAREKILSNFSEEIVSQKYIELYNKITSIK